MDRIAPFGNDERICFIGDSITALTHWIACIADYYANNTNVKPLIFPCGISGGSCKSAIKYFDRQTAVFKPDTAVIMLGMNDIGRNYYGNSSEPEKEEKRNEAFKNYENGLQTLTSMLKKIGTKRIVYLAPTPYDEAQICEAENLYGCWEALRKCAEIMKKLASKNSCEFFDFGGSVYELLCESRKQGSLNQLINSDRVHPNMLGMSVMARIFLAAQGFTEVDVNPSMICDGSAEINLCKKAQEYYKLACVIQRFWSAEWLIFASFPDDKCIEERLNHIKNNFADAEKCGEYVANLASDYETLFDNYCKNVKKLNNAIEKMY